MAVAVAERAAVKRRTREEVAKRIAPLLGDTPQSGVELATRLDILNSRGLPDNKIVLDACNVLFAWRQARRIPNTAGSPAGGWVRFDSPTVAEALQKTPFKWPFKRIEWVEVTRIGVDPRFQRPLTTFVSEIENNFDIEQFGVLILNDRGPEHEEKHGWRHSAIDGQTRWVAVTNLGAITVPSIVYDHLPFKREAGLFWRLQKNRRNVVSGDTFKARLAEGDELAIATNAIAEAAGWTIGSGHSDLKGPAALMACYRRDPVALEDVLADFKESWGAKGIVPKATHVKALHRLLREFPVDNPDEEVDIDHDRLVRRLQVNGPDDIDKKLTSVRDLHDGSPEYQLALAFQAAYLGRTR